MAHTSVVNMMPFIFCGIFSIIWIDGVQCHPCFTRQVNEKEIQIAAILPKQRSRMFSVQEISPAISLALQKVKDEMNLVGNHTLSVHYEDSMCDISSAINQAFNFYMRGSVHVFFGPCCDYAAAPVARQIRYWNLPMVTAGAMAGDFGRWKTQMYPLLTRVGPDFNSLASFVMVMLKFYKWNKLKIIYDQYGQHNIIGKVSLSMST